MAELQAIIETDGALVTSEADMALAQALECQVWGQGFAAPLFHGEFGVAEQRVVGERHLKLGLQADDRKFDAILFNHDAMLPSRIRAVYQLQINYYNGSRTLQLMLRHWEQA
jgi:single-stranded-DNA-specific exonuclease